MKGMVYICYRCEFLCTVQGYRGGPLISVGIIYSCVWRLLVPVVLHEMRGYEVKDVLVEDEELWTRSRLDVPAR